MKIVLITGSYPPDVCGVGDYTYCLAEALRTQGVSVEIVSKEKWGIWNALAIKKRIHTLKPDIVHLQYPTAGFGASLGPQMLSLLYPCVVTLHEISEAHILRKLSLLPFSVRSKQVIFTSAFERNYALRYAPWIANRSVVIPIGSNVSVDNQIKRKDVKEIVCFGLIRPNKGMEEVLALALLIKQTSQPFSIRIIGKPHPKSREYYENLRRQSTNLPVIWDIDLPHDVVADLLSRSVIAYMPFPDGASERRGSLLALLGNGVVTITTRGSYTPPGLDGAVEFAKNPEQALEIVQRIFLDNELQTTLSNKARAYSSNFTWDAIAFKHVETYEKLLRYKKHAVQ